MKRPPHQREHWRRYWPAYVLVLWFILLWVALWNIRDSRVALTSVLLMPEVLVDAPITPLKVFGKEPLREEVWLDVPDGRGRLAADVYRPADGGTYGAMVIVVGAAPEIRDHEGVVRLGHAAARAGIVVMIPELYYPFGEYVLPEDVEGLVDAFGTNTREVVASFKWLRDQPYTDDSRIGLFGASAGGGLAVVAAADREIRHDVSFVAAMGSYYDLVNLVGAITTHSVTYDGVTEEWEPWFKAVRVLHRSIISFLTDATDRDILTRIFLEEDERSRTEIGTLSEQGLEVYETLDERDPDRLLDVWGQLSPQDVNSLRAVSPSMHMQDVRTDMFIITERGDPYIPYVESRLLRDAAVDEGRWVSYIELDFLNHVEVGRVDSPASFMFDVTKLLFHVWQLLLRVM